MSAVSRGWDVLRRLPVTVLVLLVRGYQHTLSVLLGDVCRYYPSCSHYGMDALRTHGAVKGSALTAWRVLRCNPFSRGGVDDVPPRRAGSRAGRPLVLADGPGHVRVRWAPSGAPTDHTALVADTHDGRPSPVQAA